MSTAKQLSQPNSSYNQSAKYKMLIKIIIIIIIISAFYKNLSKTFNLSLSGPQDETNIPSILLSFGK